MSFVAPGSSEVTVGLVANQSGGADAAYFTVGIAFLGVVTDVELIQFGPAVSEGDSFYGTADGIPVLVIAAAPSEPGSFGADATITVATLRLVLDTALGEMGTVALMDVTDSAGAPALAIDGVTVISADLGATHAVEVPEPGGDLAMLTALVAVLARSRSRSHRRCDRIRHAPMGYLPS